MKLKPLTAALHILALSSLALAQPLYDMLGQNVEFFLMRQVRPLDVLLLIAILSAGVPALLFLAERLLLKPQLIWAGHLLLVAVLVAILCLPLFNKVGNTGWGVLAAASLVGLAFAMLYARYAAMRSLVTWLAASVVILPACFLYQSDVLRLLNDQAPPTVELGPVAKQTPIVLIIFDELSLISLLDENRQIDPIRYPHFAALAKDATWFRNATTNHQSTTYAVPALLTGKRSGQKAKPGLADHPYNLFTLLRGHYDLRIFEPYTQLCPAELRWQAPPSPGLAQRLAPLLDDLGLIQLHLLTPRTWADRLPDIARLDLPSCCSSPRVRPPRLEQFEKFLAALEPTERPALYFIHNVNPHSPHTDFPSGKKYSLEQGWPEGVERSTHTWGDDDNLVHQAYQRHLLQVCLVDQLLGRALDRLKAQGLYDQALIVVVADHGVSYYPRLNMRFIDGPNTADIARIPLLVKRPFQRQGVIDDSNVQIIDVLPTIADVQGVAIPWKVEGVSAFLPAERKPKTKRIDRYHHRYAGAGEIVLDNDLAGDFGALERKLALFGSGPVERIFAFGPCPELHGRPVEDLLVEGVADVRVNLDALKPEAAAAPDFVPAFFKGTVSREEEWDSCDLAIAVNGIVRATVSVRKRSDGTGRLVALVPEESCQSSRNLVEFFAIDTRQGEARLVRTRTRLYYPDEVLDGPAVTPLSLDSIALTNKAVQGSIDVVQIRGDRLIFEGWAADLANAQLAKSVMLFINGQLVSQEHGPIARPDVAVALRQPFLKDAGFRLSVPLASVPRKGRPKIQLVAVSPNGTSSELTPSDPYRRTLQQLPFMRRRP